MASIFGVIGPAMVLPPLFGLMRRRTAGAPREPD
jgi:hypothetical protein